MPSASAKLEKQASMETYDPMKQIVTIVEKKVRNLEKRKGKLDSYRTDSQNGKELNDDQKKAIEKYDQVVELLDFAKDLQKQFHGVMQETTKAQKKAAKREQLERQQQELQRIKEIMVYQDLLNCMNEDVRQDFLEGNKGAVKLSEDELKSIDELYKVICPERDPDSEVTNFDSTLTTSAEHVQALLDSKNKEAFGTTYKALREKLQKIYSCSYFNKSEEDATSESPVIPGAPEEKETADESENIACSEVDDFVMVHPKEDYTVVSTPSQVDMYYPMDNSSLYTEQTHPIQEVLSGQGNLNFLQESQITVGTSHPEPSAPVSVPIATYANMQQYSAANAMAPQHRTRTVSEEAAALSNHSPVATANIMLSNSPSLQQQVPIPTNLPVTQAADFDPGRPIPTQTYTNQSFSSVVHPMMAVPQNFVPVTLSHSISPAHVLPANMVVQPLSPRNVTTSSVTNPNAMVPPSATGLSSSMSALSQQANIYSLCLKMNQLNADSSQPAPPMQYESNEIQESNVNKHAGTFGNGGGNHTAVAESRSRVGSNAYSRTGQMDYGNERASYQSTNNNPAYMSRESYSDNSSYSGNLKRGLNLRGGPRGAPATRGSSMPRGGRVGYRN